MKCPECSHENPDSARFCSKCGARFKAYEEVSLADTRAHPAYVRRSVIGTKFADRYEILEDLGEGGMGRVYRVIDRQIDEEVALKVLKPEIASDEKTINRFRNELKLARKISHANVCRMYHLGVEDEIPYITMEYVPGEDLGVVIRRKGRLEVKEAVTLAGQVCAGLAEAHRLGVVHRDLKPQNIMIDKAGRARILDFGIARTVETTGSTETGMFIGTPDYMSPEQVSGQHVDQRSDVYSLGIIIFEMLTGKKPFEGDTPLSVALKHKTAPPPDPRELNPAIPEALSLIVLKCLEKEPQNRFADGGELLEKLMSIEKGLSPTVGVTFAQTEDKKPRSMLAVRLKWAGAILLATVFVVTAALILKARLASPPKADYENFILVDLFTDTPRDANRQTLEYVILRALTASTKLQIFSERDFETYRERLESKEKSKTRPVISISGKVTPRVTGFEVTLKMRTGEETNTRSFACKGLSEFIDPRMSEILEFLSGNSDGLIKGIEGGRDFSAIATGNLDALSSFLKGEEAWGKLDSDTAYFEYRTATENDPEFSLAFLRLADVQVFRGNWEDARIKIEIAFKKKDRLIAYDLLRLKALLARIDSKPAEEREYLRQLTEAFPFKKEYLYEFAESYFHVGDAEEAIKYYSKALALDPDYSLAHNHIAYSYAWMGDHQLAEEHFKKYISLDNTANSYDSLASGYMFAGRYDKAIEALQEGITLDPVLDYLYRNLAGNYLLQGSLTLAAENMNRQISVTRLETTKVSARVYLAFIELSRGAADKAAKELTPTRQFYSKGPFANRLDESPVAPFWLTGVLAARKNDLPQLRAMIGVLEKKISSNKVTATNYFPVYKFYLHLKVLEAYLIRDAEQALASIDEAKRIKNKMGYWDSIFNLPYFYNEFAAVLIDLGKHDEALELLEEAELYSPTYAETHVNLARIHIQAKKKTLAAQEVDKAREALKNADKSYILVGELESLAKSVK